MTKQDLQQIIKIAIASNSMDNWYGISKENIEDHLIEPALVNFIDASSGQIKEYWLVLDEDPSDKTHGYQIVYDQKENMFGLATKTNIETKNIGVVIGLYGSFIETLNGM
ncbi:MAG: hypothetical protein ACKV1O_26585 [Saprospiraceae bacterium]